MGHPNSGKTTFSERFKNVLHLDDYPMSKFLNCNEAVRKTDGNVVVEGIYNFRCRRERLLEAVQGKPCRKVCYWIDTPYDLCLERERNGRQRSGVVENSFVEPPTLDEGWDAIYIVRKESVMKITLEEGVETTTETLEELTNGKGEDEDE